MTERNPTPTSATLVAIDISKHHHEVLIEAPGHHRRRRLTILSTRADHDRLVETLTAYDGQIVIGFEATGDYHRGLAYRLLSAGFELRLISSVALARTREALHNSWDKNDPKDAQVILHMLKIGATQRYVDPLTAGVNDLQELSNTHEAISKAKTEIWHRILTHYLPLYFPEIARFAGNSRSDWFLAFLERFPTPGSIMALDRDSFVQEAWALVGRKQGLESPIAQRHVRDRPRLHGSAGGGGLCGHLHVPPGSGRGPQPHSPARPDRGPRPCDAIGP